MGVERPVTRWYAQRQLVLSEIASLEEQLAQIRGTQEAQDMDERAVAERTILQQLSDAQARLHALGSCPRPMMG